MCVDGAWRNTALRHWDGTCHSPGVKWEGLLTAPVIDLGGGAPPSLLVYHPAIPGLLVALLHPLASKQGWRPGVRGYIINDHLMGGKN